MKFKKQIKESFFNPVFHLFPLLLFLIVDDFFGMNTAWKITFPIAIASVLYVYYIYKRLFVWHLTFTTLFFVICSIVGSRFLFRISPFIKNNIFELVTFVFLLLFIVFRLPLKSLITRRMSKLVPMTNNFEEMYKFIFGLAVIIFFNNFLFLFISFFPFGNSSSFIAPLHYVYVSILVFFIIYEFFRVQIVRSKLEHEEWWPIINYEGKVVGSIEHKTSLADERNYIHPVVRVMIIDKGRVLLQKRANNNVVNPGLWDTAISNHVKVGESIELCIERTANERYSLQHFKYLHISNYNLNVINEIQHSFLFVSCMLHHVNPNIVLIDQVKWWTQGQIEENLNADIFSESFKLEYNLLKRSGLLESDKCDCSCNLKDTIYRQKHAG